MPASSFAKEPAFLDQSYFCQPSIASLNPRNVHWHAVRAKHPGHQMLAYLNYSTLRDYLISKLKMTETQLLGSDLVKQQYACAIFDKEIESHRKVQEIASIVLQNGVHHVVFQGKEFLVYIIEIQQGSYSASTMCILVWKDDSLDAGKHLLGEARKYNLQSKKYGSYMYRDDCLDCELTCARVDTPQNSINSVAAEENVLDLDQGGVLSKLKDDIGAFFANEELYKELNVAWKRGLILVMPGSTNETTFAKNLLLALVDKSVYILRVRFTKAMLSESFPSVCKNIFRRARFFAPCILLMERIELLQGSQKALFFEYVDACKLNNGVLFIAVTSDATKLDDVHYDRPDRFDCHYALEAPTVVGLCRHFVTGMFDAEVGKDQWLFDTDQITSYDEVIDMLVSKVRDWHFAAVEQTLSCYRQAMAAEALKKEDKQIVASVKCLLDHLEHKAKELKASAIEEAKKKVIAKEKVPKKGEVKVKDAEATKVKKQITKTEQAKTDQAKTGDPRTNVTEAGKMKGEEATIDDAKMAELKIEECKSDDLVIVGGGGGGGGEVPAKP
ncbi:hypothetical protein CBS101457_003560 [Exobasidium rhododendri]|nr:hypothetical protein CBS101457_003560 [Exobasidium rhododendri]